ncbi:hypothetical protein F183_A25390 [Bryobacterales bacterium F-183]|nr:hypothetical protein F183_A25390 [Bryobacterales bacterium F-183]
MQPRLEDRPEQFYLAIPATTSMEQLGQVVTTHIQELQAWFAAHNIQPQGPPFVRYRAIDMPARLDIEVGIPVAVNASAPPHNRIKQDTLPQGLYGVLLHTGPLDKLVEANATLQKWAETEGMDWQLDGTTWAARTETMLTPPDVNPPQVEIAYLVRDTR